MARMKKIKDRCKKSTVYKSSPFILGFLWTSVLSAVKNFFPIAAAVLLTLTVAVAAPARETTSFDEDWLFFKGEAKEAEKSTFDDSKWRSLSVPHDWSIEGAVSQKNPAGSDGAFLPSGVGWYRKKFTLPSEQAQRRVFIDFDGVMANSEVWINGFRLGKRPSGYVSFRYELTGHLNFGTATNNILVVRTDTSAQPASGWYAGAGIYRHVRLVVTDPVHIVQWGTFVSSRLTNDLAVAHVQTTVTNQSTVAREISVRANFFGPNGQFIQIATGKAQLLPPGKSVEFQQDVTLTNPQLWDPEHPNLYRVFVSVHSGATNIDDDIVAFGVREARFDPAAGFFLNGKALKIKGVCLHQDAGGLGIAVPLGAWERRLEQLKLLGCNAIRTTHNPVAPEFLDLCDRMGFLVVDEFFDGWNVAKRLRDYHVDFKEWSKIDLRDSICRDRNHPSVILYSLGNEVRDTAVSAKKTLGGLREICRECDPTRPITLGLSRANGNALNDLLDVVAHDYSEVEAASAHKKKPSRKILLTEAEDRKDWLATRDNQVYGMFYWTGVDFLGGAPKWPFIAAQTGLLDRAGMLRPQAYEVRSWWTDQPMAYMARRLVGGSYAADWTPKNTSAHTEVVEVFSNCEQVELLLNEKSLGVQSRPADDAPRIWKVPYEAGVLKVLGKNYNLPVAGHELRTAGAPAAILLSTDRTVLTPNWDDVSHVKAIVVDKDGVAVPDASDLVNFKIEGPGVIAAVDNADNTSHEPFKASERHAFKGQCVAILKATAAEGQIVVSATAPGLYSGSLTVDTSAK